MADHRDQSPGPVEALASRLDATVAQWRARLRGQILGKRVDSRPDADIATAQGDLRGQLDAIGQQAAEIERSLARDISHASAAEERAMAAVRDNDDVRARAALTEHQYYIDAARSLEAELTLLKEMAATCREALESIDDRARAISDPIVPPSNEEL